jgi:hypothetical protein
MQNGHRRLFVFAPINIIRQHLLNLGVGRFTIMFWVLRTKGHVGNYSIWTAAIEANIYISAELERNKYLN